jgi:hypothetical protein
MATFIRRIIIIINEGKEMSWVDVPQGYDAPAGEQIRIIYKIEIPEWLEWTPDQLMDFIVDGVAKIWYEIQKATANFDVKSYELKVIQSGKLYNLIIYGVSRGVPVWIVATIILSLIVAALIFFSISIDKVQKLVAPVPETIPIILIILLIIAVAFLLREVKK